MAQQHVPVVFSEALNLVNLGVNSDSIKFGSCSLESDRCITVCQPGELVMVNLREGNTVTRRPISAEAAIMNPDSDIVALRASGQLQIFNLNTKTRVKSHTSTEPVVYWKWINPTTIAIVSSTSVYHWSASGDSPPVKVFERDGKLQGTQIIGYSVSADQKWCLLMGISQSSPGVISGTMQLYSIDKRVSQILSGHTGTFATVHRPGRDAPAQVLCFEEKKPDSPAKLFIMEVGRDKGDSGGVFKIAPQPIPTLPDAPNDFPVAMAVTENDILFMITKQGYLFLFDVHTGKPLYRAKISNETVFITTIQRSTRGLMGITARSGSVLQISLNERTLIPYILNTLRDTQLAMDLAGRLNLEGANELYEMQFNQLLSSGDVAGAARLAGESPNGLLRTVATIQRFQQIPTQPGSPPPVFQYFSVLLEKGKLNAMESIELARPVLSQGRMDMLEKWLREDKLECTQEFGDLVAQADSQIALSVYLRANCQEKVVQCFAQVGEFQKIVDYCSKTGYHCDYTIMLQNMVNQNPQGALEFAKSLVSAENGPFIDPNVVTDLFMATNRVQETTAFLLEALKNNRKEEGFLQTKLLEINLLGGSPQVADAILANEMFTHFDKIHVAKMCESKGLYQRALESYTDTADIKRLMAFAPSMNPEFIVAYFGNLSRDVSIDVMKEMLGKNVRQNLQIVVQIATKYNDQIGAEPIIALFESFKLYEGLFYYLGSIVNFSQEPVVHFKYIEAATKMQQYKEVERVCRDSSVYEPEAVKKFLMEARLPDPRPLIHVCDRYDFIEEMTGYLYTSNLQKYIEVYVQKVSPQNTPSVIGKLLDLDCSEDFIRSLLNSVGHACPVHELVEHVERRNRLRLLQPWLEAQVATGNTETYTHNAIGKIYITLNRDPRAFLTNNHFYDPQVLGKYCEKLDPSLSYLAYKRGDGACDDDLIRVTTENGLFKDLSRYLVERQDLDLWAKVLQPLDGATESSSRRALIDQVVQTALPETKNADEVSATVKAFMNADLPQELIELLERIVLQGSDFSENRNLQNLLILTAIKADKDHVLEYINRIDNFDGPEIAKIAASEQYELFEEAFVIYVKFSKKAEGAEKMALEVSAIEVLVDHIRALDRAKEFAERVQEKAVWSKLAKAQLDEDLVTEAIDSYIKAVDPSYFVEVISAAEKEDAYKGLVDYLQMARKEVKEAVIENELIYALAKMHSLSDLETFIAAPNIANIEQVGERCFDEGMCEAARILFANINNNAKLALCYVHLCQYKEAVDAAMKANAVNTWKQVCYTCIRGNEFKLASICGMHILRHPDQLEELILFYERAGHSKELLQLMEQGLGLEEAHSGIFTELSILYTKYAPDRIMQHIKTFWNRMNVAKVLKACEKALLWDEAVFLYKEDGQFDSAIRVMIDHPSCYIHETFIECVTKIRNQDNFYRSISFYLESHPLQLNRLLHILTKYIDHSRAVHLLRKAEQLPLALDYLKSVQKDNISAVNEALNDLYIYDEDHESLRESVDAYDNFDQIALAQRIEKHELLAFRRISAYVYNKNRRYQQSISLSKGDKMYKDAIDTAASSGDSDIAEDLLKFFVNIGDKECFCATLYTCYTLVRPDVAMELAWHNGYMDFAMPFMIQYLRNLHEKVADIDARTKAKKKGDDAEAAAVAAAGMYDQPLLTNGVPMIDNVPFNTSSMLQMEGMGGMGNGSMMGGGGVPGMPSGMPGQGMMGGHIPGTGMAPSPY